MTALRCLCSRDRIRWRYTFLISALAKLVISFGPYQALLWPGWPPTLGDQTWNWTVRCFKLTCLDHSILASARPPCALPVSLKNSCSSFNMKQEQEHPPFWRPSAGSRFLGGVLGFIILVFRSLCGLIPTYISDNKQMLGPRLFCFWIFTLYYCVLYTYLCSTLKDMLYK